MKNLKSLCNPGACGLIGWFLFVILCCIAMDMSLTGCFASVGDFLLTICIGLPGAAIGALVGNFLKKTYGSEDPKTNNTSSTKSVAEQIAELKKLQDSGALTQEEFDEQKKKILNS